MRKIKKGDEVVVIAGKDKGKTGTVLSVVDKGARFVIEGINLVKKHVKANPNTGDRGGVVSKPASIHCSNVMLYDSQNKTGSRVGFRTLEDGRKVRYFKSTNEVVNA